MEEKTKFIFNAETKVEAAESKLLEVSTETVNYNSQLQNLKQKYQMQRNVNIF